MADDGLEFRFVGMDNAPTYHATGAWGGPLADGNLHAMLFIEHPAVPARLVAPARRVSDIAMIVEGEPQPVDGLSHVERRFVCSVVMSPTNAKEIGQWLLRQADAMLEGQAQQGIPDGEQ